MSLLIIYRIEPSQQLYCMKSARRAHSFFYITEDPPITLTNFKKISNTSEIKGAFPKNYFFMDFAQNCTLRAMNKVERDYQTVESVSQLQRFGRNIVTNIEDSSPQANQSVKYCDQLIQLMQKRRCIRDAIEKSLRKSKEKDRSTLSASIKQSLRNQYKISPRENVGTVLAHDRFTQLNSKLRQKEQTVLARLGLLRRH